MAKKTLHPLTGAEYQAEGPDAVRVTLDGKWGLFDRFGGWIEGDIRQCDPQMCIWLASLHIVEARAAQAAEEAE